MAPLTRARTGDARVPTELNAEYYAAGGAKALRQSRASATTAPPWQSAWRRWGPRRRVSSAARRRPPGSRSQLRHVAGSPARRARARTRAQPARADESLPTRARLVQDVAPALGPVGADDRRQRESPARTMISSTRGAGGQRRNHQQAHQQGALDPREPAGEEHRDRGGEEVAGDQAAEGVASSGCARAGSDPPGEPARRRRAHGPRRRTPRADGASWAALRAGRAAAWASVSSEVSGGPSSGAAAAVGAGAEMR